MEEARSHGSHQETSPPHAIAEPEQAPTTTIQDQELEKLIEDDVSSMQREALTANDWSPDHDDVAIMIKYLRRDYTRKTAQGADDIIPDLILCADQIMLECLLALLNLMASAASSPKVWRRMYIILAHKVGRDPQNLTDQIQTNMRRVTPNEGCGTGNPSLDKRETRPESTSPGHPGLQTGHRS